MIVLDQQKKKHKIVTSKVFSAIFFIFSIVALLTLVLHFGMTLKPLNKLAENGQIKLNYSDFLKQRTIALAGQWTFFDNRLVEPADIFHSLPDARTMQSTGGWQLRNHNGNQIYGHGTYHLYVQLESTGLDLAIRIPKIESAYRLYIDSKLVARGGEVSDSEDTAQPGYQPDIIPLPSGTKNFELTLQVSNYHAAWGGLWEPIVIGEIEQIYLKERDLVALSMFVLGALLVTAAFYIIQYSFRPSEQIPLAFACMCLIFFLREFTVEHMHFMMSFIGLGFTFVMKLNYLTFYLGVPTILFFMNLCFPHTFQRKISNFIYVVSGGFSAFVILAPTRIIGDSLLI
ncbi:MAG: hypothetical protein JKY14_06085, partial [Paraglaciecola sp.]|nr:hypothetical protein [Paraglaciecola sp.]